MLKKILFTTVFLLLCIGTLFLCSGQFVNVQTTPKWYCFYFGVPVIIGLLYIFKFTKEKRNELIDSRLLLSVVLVCCFVQALYGIGQFAGWFQSNGFRVTGSFDNPAGFAASLCAGAPFFWYFILDKNRVGKWLAIAALVIVGVAVILSESRAGIISFFAVLSLVGFRYLPFSKTKKILLSATILIGLLIALYFLKKDSADGRILIWKCSWEMIKDKPFLGFGSGGFKANYMNYQADYFASHSDSLFGMLADNVDRPFSEYVLLLVNHGLLGFAVLLALIIFLLKTYRNHPEQSILTSIAGWYLSGIAVFSMFSYPLTYPFVWLMGLTAIFIIIYPKLSFQRMYLIGMPVVIVLISVIYYFSFVRMRTEMQWCNIAHKSLLGQTEKMLPRYKLLHNQMKNNELFLYNYAAELNVAGDYEESLKIAGKCEELWADYDLQMLIADNYLQCKQYKQAENHYRKASMMCPVKFVPLYRLYQLYGITGDRENESIMANRILTKPVKVMSPVIQQIKKEIKGRK